MFLLIDNYDSFTYNLSHFLGELGAEVVVRRNDALTPDDAVAMQPEGIVISPGPCDPPKAGICMALVERCAGVVPMFGVCLGMQAIGQVFGGRVERAPEPKHGKMGTITHDGSGVFAGLPSPFEATRYHSLIVADDGLPDCLHVSARSEDGLIQGLSHTEFPIHGVQFHPESIASEHGHSLLKNFIDIARERKAA